MKQYLRIFSMLLLMLIGIGGGDVFGAEETFDFVGWSFDGASSWDSNYKERTVKGTVASTIFASADKNSSTITDCPVTKGGNITVTINSGYKITGVELTLKQWKTKTQTVTLNTSNDGTTFTPTSKNSSNFSLTASGLSSKAIQFTFSSDNQVGVQKIVITYETDGKTTTTTTFGSGVDNQTFKVKKGEESSFTTKTATLTPSEAGSLKYSSDNETVISVNENTGEVTFKSLGTATITAAFAGSSTHVASSASYTIEYSDPNTIVFDNTNSSFTNIPGSYMNTKTNYNFPASDGNTYSFSCLQVLRSIPKIQMKASVGTMVSPVFESTYGYKVNVYYYTSNNGTPLTITCGSLSANGQATGETPNDPDGTGYIATLSILSTSASFEIKAGGKACYVSKIEVIKFTEPQKKEAIVTFPVTSYTTLPGESFTAPTASVKNAEGDVISGARVTYSISGDDIATIDANTGAVTPKADASGTATITATYAGDATYKEATGSYTLAIKEVTVASDIANLITQGTADDTKLYSINLTQAQVLKVHESSIYLSNGTSFIAVKSLTNDAVVEGKLLSGKLIGKYSLSASIPTLTLEKEPTLNIEEGTSILAGTSISADEAEDHINELVTISGTTSINSSKQFLGNVQLYNRYGLSYAAPYAGSKLSIRGVIIKYINNNNNQLEILPLSKYDIIYHFDETANNAVGAAADVKVQLTRTLSKDYWNTFCVPFPMTTEQIAATFGEGTKVTEYASTEGTTLNFTEATAITAGVPYLIKPANTTANPAIEGVTIAADDAQEEGSTYKFIGIYSPKALATDGSELFIGTDSKLYSPAADKNTINGMRAYLKVPAGTKGARLNILGEMVTAIDGVSLNGNDEVKVFNLKGQRVGNTTKGLAKGIYVVNGKKMVINK